MENHQEFTLFFALFVLFVSTMTLIITTNKVTFSDIKNALTRPFDIKKARAELIKDIEAQSLIGVTVKDDSGLHSEINYATWLDGEIRVTIRRFRKDGFTEYSNDFIPLAQVDYDRDMYQHFKNERMRNYPILEKR